MKVDLNDKVIRVVAQEYINAIVNFNSEGELNFDVHKLIHTFQVLNVAQDLIRLTKTPLSAKVKKQILNAAVLHDIGRCHEFSKGIARKGYDHGIAGANVIKKYFPDMNVEIGCTEWHNKQPSNKDPKSLFPVLDYVRDADILGNIRYEVQNMSVFVQHIFNLKKDSSQLFKIDEEIKQAAHEERACIYAKIKKFDFLDMMLAQLLWIYNLRTDASFCYAKRFDVFKKFRDTVVTEMLDLLKGPAALKKKAAQEIMNLFPDSLFDKELKRHEL